MGMLFDGSSARAVQRKRAMTIHAKLVRGFSQLRVIVRAMRIVATEASHPAPVHHALHEIIALHAVLVSGAVGVVRERRLAQCVFLKLPEILQFKPTRYPTGQS